MPLPRVLCRGWRSPSGQAMKCAKPVMQEGEPGGRLIDGQCVTCRALQDKANAIKEQRSVRRVRRNAARGYGDPKPGEDVFRGFREEDK